MRFNHHYDEWRPAFAWWPIKIGGVTIWLERYWRQRTSPQFVFGCGTISLTYEKLWEDRPDSTAQADA